MFVTLENLVSEADLSPCYAPFTPFARSLICGDSPGSFNQG